jgi:twitching motility two-component system response regulator PilG
MKKRILVVDDSASILELETTMLKLLGYEPIAVSSGMEALKVLAQEVPDMALLDVMLPDMDGYKICKHIKGNPASAHIPVVMVTAKKTSADVEQGKKAGADEYVTKPFKSLEIAALIKKLLGEDN